MVATTIVFVAALEVRCGEVDHMVINYSGAQMRLKNSITTSANKAQKKHYKSTNLTSDCSVERKLWTEIELIGRQMQ